MLCISLVSLIFRYSVQILLENALFCWQNARLKIAYSVRNSAGRIYPSLHSSQTHHACAVPAISLQKKIETNAESFTSTVKLNAISENLSFSLWECAQYEVTGIHKFYRREIWFTGTLYVSFSYQLRARKSLNWFKLQCSEKSEVTLFFCAWPLWNPRLLDAKFCPIPHQSQYWSRDFWLSVIHREHSASCHSILIPCPVFPSRQTYLCTSERLSSPN